MTPDQCRVLADTPPFVRFGEPPHRIAKRSGIALTTCRVILEHVLLPLDYVSRSYIDRSYLWSRTPLGDTVAGRASHGR